MSKSPTTLRPATLLVHAGTERTQFDETAEALFLTSGFVYDSAESAEARFKGEEPGFIYARYGSPTVRMFEERLALLEGAQATMLDVDHGTYPFVTSSNPTAGGACVGAGIGPTRVTKVIGIIKAYTTRVGSGPFPTELLDEQGEWLRETGGEFGVTTGRARRCGWFDAVIARYSTRVNGITDLFVTKLDVLSTLEKIPVCVAYEVDGKRYDDIPMTQTDFHHAKPVYEYLTGWSEDISGAKSLADLPPAAQAYIKTIEEISGTRVSAIGVGPRRDQTIEISPLL